jgi:PAS domain S-box-containing protein
MSKLSKVSFFISIVIMSIYFVTQSLLVTGNISYSKNIGYAGYICFLLFVSFFGIYIYEYLKKNKKIKKRSDYVKKLNETLIYQSLNSSFFEGNTSEGAKVLTKEVSNSINADRCSVWLYNTDRTSIICQQLYSKKTDSWEQNYELLKEDYKPYFLSLLLNPIIVANDARNHSATSCFKDTYLDPLGIKSMLDVPISYKGDTIGVICIENFDFRIWDQVEIDFAQMLSALYSFAYSIKENNNVNKTIDDIEGFIDHSVLVSKTDSKGKIVYVNKKFEDVSGWKLSQVIGKDHNIVNSGKHTKNFWKDMYKTTVEKRKIWNQIVTNKTKKGELYWVDSYIMAEFDEQDCLKGFMSIRYDVTDLIKKTEEIAKKNVYLEHAAKILRHDMHSGINTYIPRGISSLERRLSDNQIQEYKLEAPLKMLKEGLKHAQKVYKGVYEFTNLVKKDSVLNKTKVNLKEILESYLSTTSYKSQVVIDTLEDHEVNEPLFCTAIDNLIRNGLKYNDNDNKFVHLYMEDFQLVIQDNGRGLSQEEFDNLSKPYVRKENQKESGSGLGLNICLAILKEHGFSVSCEKNHIGTKIKIKFK